MVAWKTACLGEMIVSELCVSFPPLSIIPQNASSTLLMVLGKYAMNGLSMIEEHEPYSSFLVESKMPVNADSLSQPQRMSFVLACSLLWILCKGTWMTVFSAKEAKAEQKKQQKYQNKMNYEVFPFCFVKRLEFHFVLNGKRRKMVSFDGAGCHRIVQFGG